jgi:hypothetical protein
MLGAGREYEYEYEYEYEGQVKSARFLRLSSGTCPTRRGGGALKWATTQFKICEAHRKRLIVSKEMIRSAG